MQTTLDDEEEGVERGFEVTDETKDNFMHGRDGDHVMGVCFQCDVCQFRNTVGRDVCWVSKKDLTKLRYIRRASLDVMWSRESGTVRSNWNRMTRDVREASEVMTMGHIFPKMGDEEMEDKCGMEFATIMLHASLRPGKYAEHLQFQTARKTVSWAMNAWSAISRGEDGTLFASDEKTMFSSEALTRTPWFQRFVLGVKRRMGVIRKQDEALTSLQVLALEEVGEFLWERAADDSERKEIASVLAFVVVGFCASLRGEEIPLVSMRGLWEYWEDTMPEGFVMIPLRGKFKGEDCLGWHLVPLVDFTSSGIKVRRWVHRVLRLRLTLDGDEEGPLFVNNSGAKVRLRDYNSTFQQYIRLAMERSPEAFSSKLDPEDFNLRRSMRRGSTTQSHNNKTPIATIEMMNRWRKREAARGAEPGLGMRQLYTQALSATETTLEYSRNL